MYTGKVIAWNQDTQRGIIESRMGWTATIERKDFVTTLDYQLAIFKGSDIGFEVVSGTREAYQVNSLANGFNTYRNWLEAKPDTNKKVLS